MTRTYGAEELEGLTQALDALFASADSPPRDAGAGNTLMIDALVERLRRPTTHRPAVRASFIQLLEETGLPLLLVSAASRRPLFATAAAVAILGPTPSSPLLAAAHALVARLSILAEHPDLADILPQEELAAGVRLRGGAPIRSAADSLVLILLERSLAGPVGPLPPRLAPSDRAVVEGIAAGLTNQQIAARLHRSQRAVRAAVSRLLKAHGCRHRAGLVRLLGR